MKPIVGTAKQEPKKKYQHAEVVIGTVFLFLINTILNIYQGFPMDTCLSELTYREK